jgi:hypothetical protein
MWQLIAIVLIAIIWFYLGAIYLTVVAWLNAIGHLLQGHFTRAAAWGCVGVGMAAWWNGTATIPDPADFDAWLKTSAWVVGFGALLTFIRFCHRHRRAAQAAPPFEPAPFEPAPIVVNINIELSPHADRRAVHDDLAAIASALRGAIGTKQSPRRIPGPTIID